MNSRSLPVEEASAAARLQLLHELHLSDGHDQPAFDALVRAVASATGCPMAALTLIDAQRQVFKASVGLGLREAPRQHGLCSLAMRSADVLVLPDLAADARFAAEPLVTGPWQVRFYAGAPITVEGHRVGSVCCLSDQPRQLSTELQQLLRDLAQVAAAMLHDGLAARRLALRAAELAHVAKSEFLSRMSHELRTPLNAVIGFTQLLLSRPGMPDATEVRDYAEHVLRAGERLLALTNDVLDLQRVEEGRVDLEIVDLPLDGVVDDVIAQLAAAADERGVAFDNHVVDGVAVCADARRLRQVLHNIASNAVKYNRPAGVVRWSVDATASEGRVRLSIEDTGSGLKPEQLNRLFQPFERLGRETSTIEGTGLGLIIARSLAAAMGASLQVASAAGIGTRVIVDLPMAQQTTLPFTQPVELDAPVADMPSAPAGSLRMLYVEDNRINAILFEEAIRLRAGVELRLAEDGHEALDQVRDWTPHILVLDAHLPGMDGFELLDALRRQPGLGEVPAFMCSADAMPDDIERAAAAGFAGYWSKPINIARIMSDLDRVSAGLPPAPAEHWA